MAVTWLLSHFYIRTFKVSLHLYSHFVVIFCFAVYFNSITFQLNNKKFQFHNESVNQNNLTRYAGTTNAYHCCLKLFHPKPKKIQTHTQRLMYCFHKWLHLITLICILLTCLFEPVYVKLYLRDISGHRRTRSDCAFAQSDPCLRNPLT